MVEINNNIHQLVVVIVTMALLSTTIVGAFTTSTMIRHRITTTTASSLEYSVHDEDKPIQCFLLQVDADHDDASPSPSPSPPEVICTSNPDEYAWFNGIQREDMIPATDGIYDEAVQCVQGESPRGVPEWECLSAYQ
jgi:hypothetical protein